MNKRLKWECPNCGFSMQHTMEKPTYRGKMKDLTDTLITSKLFCCTTCVKAIKNKINYLRRTYA